MYQEFGKKFSFPELEQEILKFWKGNNIFHKSLEIRKNSPRFVFYEGPPTANGRPGIHHVISRTIKDLVCRYKTMQGFLVERKAGWDTHGLPVELEVEKELKLESKAKIIEYGIAKFNQKCKESVFRYKKDWDWLTERIGYWLDLEDAYITCSNEYIETVWWILSEYFNKGFIYRGNKIVPWCPRCGTGLSSHEVALGYDQVEDPSVFVKVQLEDSPNTYFLVWTTTPWTLISNVSLALNPEATYVEVSHNKEKLILAKERLEVLKGDYTIEREYKGKELEKTKYKPLFAYVKLNKPAYYATVADFVSLGEGTGIVHIAPAFGADDHNLGQIYNLPKPQPIDETGKFTAEVTPWKGMFIKDADPLIMQDLKKRGLLYKEEKCLHSYPFCWRCDTPLIYYARKSWYIKTTAYKDKLIANNNKINWYPPEVGKGRFGEWLENNVDWSLSRERFWGTPLNIWVCEKCHSEKSVSSISELQKLGENIPDPLDLHKPFVDQITLKCEKCSGKMYRTPEVIDVWFDSGAMPYAQWHYPFENQDRFKQNFPSDFISEAIDQTRGWFYSLLAISAFLFDQPAYKKLIVIEFIQDKFGQKMSKSKGNVVEPEEILNKDGADALRWYLLSVSQPWIPTKFDPQGVTEVTSKFLGTLLNTYSFWALYANIDKFKPHQVEIPVKERPEIDRWLVSKLNSLVLKVNQSLEEYELTRVARWISDFVIDDLSNWYVRRNRRRFWKSKEDQDKLSAYQTLWEALVTVCKLSAPYIPFTSEKIYQELVAKVFKRAPESIHLENFPQADIKEINKALEDKMEDLIKVVILGRACRNKAKVKVRQPLEEMLVVFPSSEKMKAVKELSYLIAEEINVKKVNFPEKDTSLVTFQAKPNFAHLGPKFGAKVKAVADRIQALTPAEIENYKKSGKITLQMENDTITLETLDLEIVEIPVPGFAVESENGYQVALKLALTEELKDEGFARELVNKIQTQRKESGFQVTDRIKIAMQVSERLKQAISNFGDYIQKETLADKLILEERKSDFKLWDINGEKAYIHLQKT
ncbi:MAG: isoleucine--tRNA ligase [candidate division Zixibacteria bacterium RBG_16_40_9]|nr:MAG: isoleucine--tRNA ligase [candidate division Zixibacteria bacterium RBG_16_40_9]